jgi:hypothetical protein
MRSWNVYRLHHYRDTRGIPFAARWPHLATRDWWYCELANAVGAA